MDDQAGWSAERGGESAFRSVAAFLRSVIPADPWQLLFLAGTILLLVTTRVSWRPEGLVPDATLVYRDVYVQTLAGNLVVLAAGLMALYACFWPLRAPVRKVFWGVLVTGLLGLSMLLWRFFHLAVGERSILDTQSRPREMFAWAGRNFSSLPTGFSVLILGLVLVSIFLSRMALRAGSLPLALCDRNAAEEEVRQAWPGDRLVLFVLIGVFGLLENLSYLLARLLWILPLAHARPIFTDYVFGLVSALLDAGLLLGVSLYVLGRRGRTPARLSLAMPEPRFLLVALFLPAAAYALMPAGYFVVDRMLWAATEFGKFSPPVLSTYIDLGSLGNSWVVFLIFGAFAEEIIFRGVLLPDFIRRYGLQRGIFLTGIGWAAIHFRSDSYSGLSVSGVLLAILLRIISCLGMNYVLAWMVLRWGSIVPAGIAHTVWNMLVLGRVSAFEQTRLFDLCVWLLIAWCLFRFWPVVEK